MPLLCARSTSVSCTPIVKTGLSEFIALWKTTEICDQRSSRISSSSRSNRSCSPSLPWNSAEPPVITPGSRSSRVTA
jgi:hypothetical protein